MHFLLRDTKQHRIRLSKEGFHSYRIAIYFLSTKQINTQIKEKKTERMLGKAARSHVQKHGQAAMGVERVPVPSYSDLKRMWCVVAKEPLDDSA